MVFLVDDEVNQVSVSGSWNSLSGWICGIIEKQSRTTNPFFSAIRISGLHIETNASDECLDPQSTSKWLYYFYRCLETGRKIAMADIACFRIGIGAAPQEPIERTASVRLVVYQNELFSSAEAVRRPIKVRSMHR